MAFIGLKIKIIIHFVVFRRRKKTTIVLKRVLIRGGSPTTRPINFCEQNRAAGKFLMGQSVVSRITLILC